MVKDLLSENCDHAPEPPGSVHFTLHQYVSSSVSGDGIVKSTVEPLG
ncbi:hypothetical protein ES703_24559 [subsurface metagenome]